MNLESLAKQFLKDHGLNEGGRLYDTYLADLLDLLETVAYHEGVISSEPEYDPSFGDNRKCQCGHTYYRHFDTYDNMSAVGCKYCSSWEDVCRPDYCNKFTEEI